MSIRRGLPAQRTVHPSGRTALTDFVDRYHASAIKEPLGLWFAEHPAGGWAEPKYDGVRLLFFYTGGQGVYATKHQGERRKADAPELFSDLPRFNAGRFILDGEGWPKAHPTRYAAFDVLNVDGKDMRGESQSKRRQLLEDLFQDTEGFAKVQTVKVSTPKEAEETKERFVREGFEGAVLKDSLARYGERGSWVKAKKFDDADVLIIRPDSDDPEFKRTNGRSAHAWFIGVRNAASGEIVPYGRVGNYVADVNPVTIKAGDVVEVRFQEKTKDKRLRDAYILRTRPDKTADEVTSEDQL